MIQLNVTYVKIKWHEHNEHGVSKVSQKKYAHGNAWNNKFHLRDSDWLQIDIVTYSPLDSFVQPRHNPAAVL